MSRSTMLVVCVLWCLSAIPTPAIAAPTPSPLVTVWIPSSATLSATDLKAALQRIAAVDPSPQHLLVLVHGWDNSRDHSRYRYETLVPMFTAGFAARHERVVVVGVQWPSNVGTPPRIISTYIAHQLIALVGLGRLVPDPYGSKIVLGRRIGFGGLRQLLFAIDKRFPQATVELIGHSMGALVVWGAVRPLCPQWRHDKTPRFEPERAPRLDLLCLLGADLDADVFRKDAQLGVEGLDRLPRLVWVTVPGLLKGGSGGVLHYHHLARFKAALGNSLPLLTEAQWKTFVGGQRMLFYRQEHPNSHEVPADYTVDFTRRFAAVAADLRDGTHRSRDIEELYDARRAPDSVGALRPFLDSDLMETQLYTLWRLEMLVDGNARFLANGYLLKFGRECYRTPNVAATLVAKSPCALVRHRLYPTPALWATSWAEAKR